LRQAGRAGYVRSIRDDITLARSLHRQVAETPTLEAGTQHLSITTFRYVPADLTPGLPAVEEYLNRLNTEVLSRLQAGGEAFVSNAVVRGTYLLRACIVNFRTTEEDIAVLPAIVTRIGAAVDAALRPAALRSAGE
jgi:glutamate/tyrosine decarboxylase-like PLP-dependent enzyme